MSTPDLHLYAKPMTQPEVLALVPKGFFVKGCTLSFGFKFCGLRPTFNRSLCDRFEKLAKFSVSS